ncbi:NADP-dependent isocitrate dehydrogenase [Moorena sp. SIO1F2]|uniref:NADP-dependent isocitrate dehydrogenase n=1 Tax=Moorena sp. SIO1F2 TaxID=2607819 RepID=UPI00345C07E0
MNRARATGASAVFWLDKYRAHDAQLIDKVEKYLPDHDLTGLDIHVLPPVEAMRFISSDRPLANLEKMHQTYISTG